MELSKIYEGWSNHLFPSKDLKPVIKEVSASRLEICRACPHHSSFHNSVRIDEHCTYCGCPLIAKTKCLSCECPLEGVLKQWKAYITREEEGEIYKSNPELYDV